MKAPTAAEIVVVMPTDAGTSCIMSAFLDSLPEQTNRNKRVRIIRATAGAFMLPSDASREQSWILDLIREYAKAKEQP